MNHFIDLSETFFSFLFIFFSSHKLGFTFEWINNVINGNLKTEFSHIFQARNLPSDADVAMRAIESDFLVFRNLNFYSVMAFNFSFSARFATENRKFIGNLLTRYTASQQCSTFIGI